MFKALLTKLRGEAPIAPGSLLEQCVLLMLQIYSESDLPELFKHLQEHLQRLNAQTTSPEPRAHLWRLAFLRLWQQRQANFCIEANPPFDLTHVNAQLLSLVITKDTPIDILNMKHDDGQTLLGRAINFELIDFTNALLKHIQTLYPHQHDLTTAMILGDAQDNHDYFGIAAGHNDNTLFKLLLNHCLPILMRNKQLRAVLILLVEQYRPIAEQFYAAVCHRLAKRVTVERLTEIAQLLISEPEKKLSEGDQGPIVLIDVLYQLHAIHEGGEDILRTCLPRAQGTSYILAEKLLAYIEIFNSIKHNPQHPLLQCHDNIKNRIHEMPQKNDCCLSRLTRLTRQYLNHYQSIRYFLTQMPSEDEGIHFYTTHFFARENNASLTPLAPYLPATLPAFIRIMLMLNKSLLEKQLRQAAPGLRAHMLKISHGQLIQMNQQHHLGDENSMFGTFFYSPQVINLNFPFMFLANLVQLPYIRSIVASMLQTLIENGLSPNVVSAHGITPLNFALLTCDHQLTQQLIAHGANVNINYRNHDNTVAFCDGSNLLHILDLYRIANEEIKEPYLRTAKLLLAAGASVYLPCRGIIIQEPVLNGMTPFEYAFTHHLSELCESMVATQQNAQELYEKVTRIAIDLSVLRGMIQYRIPLTHNARKNAPAVLEHLKNKLAELKSEQKRPFSEMLQTKYLNTELRFYFAQSEQPALLAEYDALCHRHFNLSKISAQPEENVRDKENDRMFAL